MSSIVSHIEEKLTSLEVNMKASLTNNIEVIFKKMEYLDQNPAGDKPDNKLNVSMYIAKSQKEDRQAGVKSSRRDHGGRSKLENMDSIFRCILQNLNSLGFDSSTSKYLRIYKLMKEYKVNMLGLVEANT